MDSPVCRANNSNLSPEMNVVEIADNLGYKLLRDVMWKL
jgi:hypothetical protein